MKQTMIVLCIAAGLHSAAFSMETDNQTQEHNTAPAIKKQQIQRYFDLSVDSQKPGDIYPYWQGDRLELDFEFYMALNTVVPFQPGYRSVMPLPCRQQEHKSEQSEKK